MLTRTLAPFAILWVGSIPQRPQAASSPSTDRPRLLRPSGDQVGGAEELRRENVTRIAVDVERAPPLDNVPSRITTIQSETASASA